MKHILVIDDDSEIRILLRKFLEMHNFLVSEAENGKKALELCRSTQFDLIISDIYMPEKDGITFIKDLHKIASEIKIIAISGGEPGHFFTSDLQLDVAKTVGAFHTLRKPFKMDDLLKIIENVFSHERKLQTGNGQLNEFLPILAPTVTNINIRFITQHNQLFKIMPAIAALAAMAEKKEVTIQLYATSREGFDSSLLNHEVFKALEDAQVKIVSTKE
ncbi:MAG: response regulator [Planctomycetes bacterium]|nr:response regulator [Planctomycetota bacterium]